MLTHIGLPYLNLESGAAWIGTGTTFTIKRSRTSLAACSIYLEKSLVRGLLAFFAWLSRDKSAWIVRQQAPYFPFRDT